MYLINTRMRKESILRVVEGLQEVAVTQWDRDLKKGLADARGGPRDPEQFFPTASKWDMRKKEWVLVVVW
jgi:hypothetical protein